jgi:hypothetical protein
MNKKTMLINLNTILISYKTFIRWYILELFYRKIWKLYWQINDVAKKVEYK